MLFNSVPFLVFFPVVTLLYFILPHTYRKILLLVASCIFYMFFKPVYILILFFTIGIDYSAGLLIENTNNRNAKKKFLVASIISNIGVLAVFKYFNFFAFNFNLFAHNSGLPAHIPLLDILLPIGLSFHTFQAMSYTIEVFRGNQRAERNVWVYSLYVMYYPQLVAGPIERPQNMLHQLKEEKSFDYDRVVSGLKQMLMGFFKKMVVADRLSMYVNNIFDNVTGYHGIPLIWASLFFTFQIYCDFSGYSDIAIGASRVMGITLMQNFNNPFLSTSMRDFWGRWHISLSTWFRDYLYIPLGGNRVEGSRLYFNIFIVFLLSGIWHGASWNFALWGVVHALFVITGRLTDNFQKRVGNLFASIKLFNLFRFINWGITFLLIILSFVIFRLTHLSDIIYVFSNYTNISGGSVFGVLLFNRSFNLMNVFLILFILFMDFCRERKISFAWSVIPRTVYNYLYFVIILIVIYMFGIFEQQSFIYFQF